MKLWPLWAPYVPDVVLVHDPHDVDGMYITPKAYFARSCPPKPEHGYLESVPLESKAHLKELLEKTLKLHPDSEIMLMPLIKYLVGSFVWTPQSVAFGPSNDGATAGKGSVRLPLVPVQLAKELLDAAGIPEGETPFVEGLAQTEQRSHLVQLRYGPNVPMSLDFVPEDVEVKSVVKAEGDLMEFAVKVKGLEAGTVVEHVGGTLLSHYGVHCLTNGVPILTTRCPEVGEKLRATPKWAAEQKPEEVARWTMFALRDAASRNWTVNDYANACSASLFLVHHSAALGDHPELVGAAMAILVKLCAAACHGEARHASNDDMHGVSRTGVFKRRLQNSFEAFAALDRKRQMFEQLGTRYSSVGGQAWAQCTTVTIDLIEAIKDLAEKPNQETLAAALSQANVAVNEAHNGGWWLNKFVLEQVFDACSTGSPVAAGYALPGVLGILEGVAHVKPAVMKRVAEKRRKDLLAYPRMERRGVQLIETGNNWTVNPNTGMMFTLGKRFGYAVKAPEEVVKAVASGKWVPNVSVGADPATPLKDGVGLSIVPVERIGYLRSRNRDGVDTKAEEFRRVEVGTYGYPDYAQVRHCIGEYTSAVAEPPRMLCVQCFRLVDGTIGDDGKCADCGGSVVPFERDPCQLCGKRDAMVLARTPLHSQKLKEPTLLCGACLMELISERVYRQVTKEREEAEAAKSKKDSWLLMCGAKNNCSSVIAYSTEPDADHKYGCGCDGKFALKALSLKSLKGLNEQEKEAAKHE